MRNARQRQSVAPDDQRAAAPVARRQPREHDQRHRAGDAEHGQRRRHGPRRRRAAGGRGERDHDGDERQRAEETQRRAHAHAHLGARRPAHFFLPSFGSVPHASSIESPASTKNKFAVRG